ncbi:unnamed protein product [Symbiodinium natans]|uniref:Uncharacterized protein n=1 Tax=Symbiodinium natans TaxID=878477 RepID=A0A812V7X8_9DINO|nr:unnamed protein product [Symbiodinium natans]
MPFDLDTPWNRLFAFAAFYVIEGIPQGFTETFLPYHFWDSRPWAYKWLLAPLIDIFWTRRRWLFTTQAVMILSLLGLLVLTDLQGSFAEVLGTVFVHNVFSATQDLAIDAIAVGSLPLAEGASANGAMFAAQEFGNMLGGAVALAVSSQSSYQGGCLFVVGLLALAFFGITCRLHPTVGVQARRPDTASQQLLAYVRSLRESCVGPEAIHFWLGMAFALFPSGTLLLRGPHCKSWMVMHSLDDDSVAWVEFAGKTVTICTMLAGGFMSSGSNRKKWVAMSYVSTMCISSFVAWLSWTGGKFSFETWLGIKVAFHFVHGFHIGPQMALFQQLCRPSVAATQFTIFCCLCNNADSWGKRFQGAWIESDGYARTLLWEVPFVLTPLAILPFIEPENLHTD